MDYKTPEYISKNGRIRKAKNNELTQLYWIEPRRNVNAFECLGILPKGFYKIKNFCMTETCDMFFDIYDKKRSYGIEGYLLKPIIEFD